MIPEVILKQYGFESQQEFNQLVASINISTPEKREAFKEWQQNDGTKEGLLRLKEELA